MLNALLNPNSEFWYGCAFGVTTCFVSANLGKWWRKRKESEGE